MTELRDIFKEKKKLTFVVVFHWKRRVRKEMAGGEGKGREEKGISLVPRSVCGQRA